MADALNARISRSAFDLQAVFETVAESSVRLYGLTEIWRFDGELLRMAVAFNAPQGLKDFVSQNPVRPGRNSAAGRAALERQTVHIPDVLVDSEFTFGSKNVEAIRTVLSVPILKGDDLLGVMTIYHLEGVRPFADKQIALVETFADQAAIAIENVRLLDELRERTDELGRSVGELGALGDVTQAVNSRLDLETVLSTIIAKAVKLSSTDAGVVYVFDEQDQIFRVRATYGLNEELIAALKDQEPGISDAMRQTTWDRQPLFTLGLSGFTRKPMMLAFDTTSCNSPSCFCNSSAAKKVTPVIDLFVNVAAARALNYSITSSAVICNISGRSSPSALAADREVVAQYADTANRCSGCLREALGRVFASRNL